MPAVGANARWNLELARRYPEMMSVATVAHPFASRYDAAEDYQIERQTFVAERSAKLFSQVRWARWLAKRCRDRVQVLHCGSMRPEGMAVWWAHKRLGVPYILYVSGPDLIRERNRCRASAFDRRVARLILGDAAGIVTPSAWCAATAGEVMAELGISAPPPVASVGLGADSGMFRPSKDTGSLRQRWGIRRAPIMLTVGKLVPHKGQDVGIRALAKLRDEFPALRYILVGEGVDEIRLRNLAAELDVMNLVGFAGQMMDDELPEAYATSTVYLGLSRVEEDGSVDGFGITTVEAAASGLPVVVGDAGGVSSSVREGETGFVVDPTNVDAVVEAVAKLLRDEERRGQLGEAGRVAVEKDFTWQKVVDQTSQFVRGCVAGG